MMILGVAIFITAIFSFIISGLMFGGNKANAKVPTAPAISTNFPDVKNDPSLSAIFNVNALDPAQPVQPNNTQNTQPFNNANQ